MSDANISLARIPSSQQLVTMVPGIETKQVRDSVT